MELKTQLLHCLKSSLINTKPIKMKKSKQPYHLQQALFGLIIAAIAAVVGWILDKY